MTRILAATCAALFLLPAVAQARPGHGGGRVPGDIREASATGSATGNESVATATASCPPSTKAVGGGFSAPPSADVIGIGIVYESVKVDQRSWRASAQLLDLGGGSTTLTLTTYAYCRSRVPATRTTTATVPTSGEPQAGPTVTATCPRGTAPLAGGFTMPPPLHAPVVSALYFDSLRSGTNAWETRAVTGPAGPSTVTTEAYCARDAVATTEADGATAPNAVDFSSSTAVAACPAGLSPSSGGFAQPDSGFMSFFFVYESRRAGSSWQVSALHSGGSPAAALDAAAYCG